MKRKRKATGKEPALEGLTADAILENLTEGVGVADAKMRIVRANAALAKMLGFKSAHELIGNSVYDFVPRAKEKIRQRPETMRTLREGKALRNVKGMVKTKDGKTIPVLVSLTPIKDRDGNLLWTVVILRDITELEQAEEELRESEKEYKTLAENVDDLLLRVDLKGNFTYMSKSFEQETGYTREEILGKNIKEILTPESLKVARDRIRKWKEGARNLPPYEVEARAKDGRIVPFELSTSPFFEEGKLKEILVVARNVVERKRMVKELLETKEYFQKLVETMNEGLETLDERGVFTYTNDSFCEMLGYSRDELIGRHITDFVDKDYYGILEEQGARRRKGEKGSYELVWVKKDGGRAFTKVAAVPILDDEGNFRGSFAVITDITKQKQRMQAAESAREFAEIVLQTVREPLVVLDANLRVITANRSFYLTFKVKPEETEGRFLYELGNRQWDIPELRRLLEEIVEKDTVIKSFEVEHDFPRIGRRTMSLNARRVQREINGTRMILLAIQDITERKRTEAKFREFIYKVNGISPGECYLHRSHETAYWAFSQLLLHGVPGLCFAREKPEKLQEYSIPSDRVILVSSIPVRGFENVEDIQQVGMKISEFLDKNKNSVVLLDGLEYFISRSSFDAVYRFLQEKRFSFMEKKSVLLMPVDLAVFTEKERALLTSEIKPIG